MKAEIEIELKTKRTEKRTKERKKHKNEIFCDKKEKIMKYRREKMKTKSKMRQTGRYIIWKERKKIK